MPRAAPLLLPLLLVPLLAACGGGPPADLFVVSRTGTIPGAALALRLTDDGGAYCNRQGRREVTSAQLIEARELRRLLDGEDGKRGLAQQGLRLPPGPGSILSYRVRSENGVVAWSDTSRGQPAALFRLAKLTRDVARQDCRLAR